MGCGSSKEATPQPGDGPQTAQVPQLRSVTPPAQVGTSSIHPTSTRASHNYTSTRNLIQQNSNTSTPRSSALGRNSRPRNSADAPLVDHYNLPLQQPPSWTSTERTWTRVQLQKERDDFFLTRVTGSSQIWAALKEVTELIRQFDIPTAQGILTAAGITLPSGDLTIGAYDERGALYKVPQHIITDPENLLHDTDGAETETIVGDEALSKKIDLEDKNTSLDGPIIDEKQDKGKEAIEPDALRIRCRLSDRGGPDSVVLLGQTQPVATLIRRLRNEATISSSARVRTVYFGKILDESKTLQAQGWREGHVVQVLVTNVGP